MSKQIVNTEPTGQNSGYEDTDRRTTTCAESPDAQKDVLVPDGGSVVDQSAKKSSPHIDSYKVYPSRLRTGLFAIGSLLFTVAILYFIGNGLLGDWYQVLMAYAGLVLFGAGTVFMTYITLKNDPVIEISNEGVQHNQPVVSGKSFSWQNIQKISRAEQNVKYTTAEYLMIHLTSDPDENDTLDSPRDDMKTVPIKDDSELYLVPIESYGISFDEVAEKIPEYSDVPVLGDLPPETQM